MKDMNEAKREDIRGQAKKILANFAKSLAKVKLKEKAVKEEIGGFRAEGAPAVQSADFRNRVFENAPEKDGDCIIAEKKQW